MNQGFGLGAPTPDWHVDFLGRQGLGFKGLRVKGLGV